MRSGTFSAKIVISFASIVLLAFASAYESASTTEAIAPTGISVLSTHNIGLLVPLYSYPSASSWNALESLKLSYSTVPVVAVINPDSGPGASQILDYINGIKSLRSAGITVIGYVPTGYGSVAVSTVEREISDYENWYNISGIFFDEMSSKDATAPYYRALAARVTGLTVGNPGNIVQPELIGIFDILEIYDVGSLPSNLSGFGSVGYISYGFPSLPSKHVLNLVNQYFSWMYVTDLGLPNPYSSLPSYISEAFEYVNSYDASINETTTQSGRGNSSGANLTSSYNNATANSIRSIEHTGDIATTTITGELSSLVAEVGSIDFNSRIVGVFAMMFLLGFSLVLSRWKNE